MVKNEWEVVSYWEFLQSLDESLDAKVSEKELTVSKVRIWGSKDWLKNWTKDQQSRVINMDHDWRIPGRNICFGVI